MTFVASTTPDITEGIPTDITTRTAGSGVASAQGGRTRWDVAIDGIGLTIASTDDSPYRRQSEVSQKQQLDTSVEAGEQRLSGYWLRSQTSWHHGYGINFYEPGVNDAEALPSRYRFNTSVGVDPWTIGDLRLLKKTVNTLTTTSTTSGCAGFKTSAGVDSFFTVDNSVLKRWTAAGVATTYTGGLA